MDDVHAREAGGGSDRDAVERFTGTGRGAGVFALLVLAVVLLVPLVDRSVDYPLWVYPGCAAAALLAWMALLRPDVRVEGEDLVLRNLVDTVRIPLAAVEQLTLRQFLAVRVAGKRYVGSGLSRSRRDTVRDGRHEPGRTEDLSYGGFVEHRLRTLVEEARERTGGTRTAEEQRPGRTGVRREPAWPEVGLLVVLAGLFVVALVV